MVVIISNTGKDHSKPYVFRAYIPASNYQRVIILRLKLVRQPCLFNLRILRFSFFFNIFLRATSNEQVLLLQFEQQTRFSYPVTIQRNCLSIFIHEWQGWSQIPNSAWSFEAWNDCRRIEGIHRVTGRAKLRNLLWIWHSVAPDEGILFVPQSNNKTSLKHQLSGFRVSVEYTVVLLLLRFALRLFLIYFWLVKERSQVLF